MINEQVDRYRAVSADTVNALIAKRFGEDNRASLLYVPRDEVESETALAVAAGAV